MLNDFTGILYQLTGAGSFARKHQGLKKPRFRTSTVNNERYRSTKIQQKGSCKIIDEQKFLLADSTDNHNLIGQQQSARELQIFN